MIFSNLNYFPINVYKQNISEESSNIRSLNLLINLNLLLILSLLPYNILDYKYLILFENLLKNSDALVIGSDNLHTISFVFLNSSRFLLKFQKAFD